VTAGQLKRLLARVPDDALLLKGGPDHSFKEIDAAIVDVAKEGRAFCEWTGDQRDYAEPVKVVKAIVFR
jgi:hypothetical protein